MWASLQNTSSASALRPWPACVARRRAPEFRQSQTTRTANARNEPATRGSAYARCLARGIGHGITKLAVQQRLRRSPGGNARCLCRRSSCRPRGFSPRHGDARWQPASQHPSSDRPWLPAATERLQRAMRQGYRRASPCAEDATVVLVPCRGRVQGARTGR